MKSQSSPRNVGKIDFNADIGESFAGYELGLDSEIIKYITSANIATGFHAGDPDWMAKTVSLAVKNDVGIGAHPGRICRIVCYMKIVDTCVMHGIIGI